MTGYMSRLDSTPGKVAAQTEMTGSTPAFAGLSGPGAACQHINSAHESLLLGSNELASHSGGGWKTADLWPGLGALSWGTHTPVYGTERVCRVTRPSASDISESHGPVMVSPAAVETRLEQGSTAGPDLSNKRKRPRCSD